jgi:hypothetical protein
MRQYVEVKPLYLLEFDRLRSRGQGKLAEAALPPANFLASVSDRSGLNRLV